MTCMTIQLAALTLLATPVLSDPPDSAGGFAEQDEPLQIVWSAPVPGGPSEVATWSDGFHRELRPVLSAWVRFRRRLQGELPALFDPQCTALVDSLDRIDHAVVLPAPDLLIDLYVRRLMTHLDAAAVACTRRELYNVLYRLDEAGSALGELRWLLAQRGLGY